MDRNFFEMKSPRDMLEKAKRDFVKMQESLNTDTILNFFITAWHVMDYVKSAMGCAEERQNDRLPKPIQELYVDEDFYQCQFICDKGKHLLLTAKRHQQLDKSAETKHNAGAQFGASGFDEAMYDEAPSNEFLVDGQVVDIIQLGERVRARWKPFLKTTAFLKCSQTHLRHHSCSLQAGEPIIDVKPKGRRRVYIASRRRLDY